MIGIVSGKAMSCVCYFSVVLVSIERASHLRGNTVHSSTNLTSSGSIQRHYSYCVKIVCSSTVCLCV